MHTGHVSDEWAPSHMTRISVIWQYHGVGITRNNFAIKINEYRFKIYINVACDAFIIIFKWNSPLVLNSCTRDQNLPLKMNIKIFTMQNLTF